jgi:hypothetical protein
VPCWPDALTPSAAISAAIPARRLRDRTPPVDFHAPPTRVLVAPPFCRHCASKSSRAGAKELFFCGCAKLATTRPGTQPATSATRRPDSAFCVDPLVAGRSSLAAPARLSPAWHRALPQASQCFQCEKRAAVRSGSFAEVAGPPCPRPLLPRQRTSKIRPGTSVRCHERTHAALYVQSHVVGSPRRNGRALRREHKTLSQRMRIVASVGRRLPQRSRGLFWSRQ